METPEADPGQLKVWPEGQPEEQPSGITADNKNTTPEEEEPNRAVHDTETVSSGTRAILKIATAVESISYLMKTPPSQR